MLTMQTNMLREAVVVASWAVRGCSAVWLVKGVLLINVKSYFNATWFLLLSVL